MASTSLDPITGRPRFIEGQAPQFGADLNEVGTFAAQGGTRQVGTTAERDAYKFKRPGLLWHDTTLKQDFVVVDGAWVRWRSIVGGRFTGRSSSTGILTVPHTLGVTPSSVVVTLGSVASEPVMLNTDHIIWGIRADSFDIRFITRNGASWFVNTDMAGFWTAIA